MAHAPDHKQGEIVSRETDVQKRPGNIFIGTLNIASQPGKLVTKPAHKIFHKHYRGKRFGRTLFVLDLIMLGLLIAAVSVILALTVFRPPTVAEQVKMDATVAPRDVVSGASSTLVIHYENQSDEELRHARLALSFPAHFLLQEVQTDLVEIGSNVYDLGTLAPGANGNVKLRGVMFGDVGGEQTFTSTLAFVYGEQNRSAQKTSTHTFQPVASTLALELRLPDRLVEGQMIQGTIVYKNTGEVDFPEITLEPEWPDGFRLTQSTPSLTDGVFSLSALKAGEEGSMQFIGSLPSAESARFVFLPRFSFGDTSYAQETLTHTVALLPSQLDVDASLSASVITPGQPITITLTYTHVGELPASHVTLRIDSEDALVGAIEVDENDEPELALVTPGQSGSFTVTLPIGSRLDPGSLTTYENLQATIWSTATYTLPGDDAPVRVSKSVTTLPVTSPVVLESFGRYASPQGDQLGRGPLPPLVGETTKYWVFLTVRGTTNELSGVRVEAELGPSVNFTGKQSVSYGNPVSFDAGENAVVWSAGSLSPTLAPGSQVVSVAFEVAVTPIETMTGTTPTLVVSPLLTAQDAFTGAFVSARGATVTTNLPYDSMAAGFGVVQN